LPSWSFDILSLPHVALNLRVYEVREFRMYQSDFSEPHQPASVRPKSTMSENVMPRAEKSKYTDKQERKADHIAQGYEERGVPQEEAERRAWATVNKDDAGGKRAGAGRGKRTGHPAAHKGGAHGGKASASRSAEERSASARKAAATRKRNSEQRAQQ
jgi:plasmid stabilization system protein ParE